MSRDDFSEATKRILCDRVGSNCSNPDCGASTRGPKSDGNGAVNVGVAAHIHAASEGGARYDSSQTPDERSAPANGIWLCANCASLIDRDPIRFSATYLRYWKGLAEYRAECAIGKTDLVMIAPMRMSADASALMHKLAREYVEAGFPIPGNARWSAEDDREETAFNELRAFGLMDGHQMSSFYLSPLGVKWVMRNQ